MVAALIATGALILLVWEMLRDRPQVRSFWVHLARYAPFVIVSLLSVYAAARAPRGRKPFQVDLSVSYEDVVRSMTKIPHLRSIAVLLLLATLAFGTRRLLVAFVATMLVGISWEIAQMTVVGHHARVADLAPNFAAGAATLLALVALRAACYKARGSPRKNDEGPLAC